MDYKAITAEIIESLESVSTPRRQEMSRHSFPTSQRVIGVTNPDMKEVGRAVRSNYTGWSEQQWIALCKNLVEQDVFECQVVAYEMIGRDRKLLNALTYDDLMALWRNLDNWASVDHYTVGIFGVLWGRGVVKDPHIDKLLDSDSFWDRRVAVVSTVALNLRSRGGTVDRTFTSSNLMPIWIAQALAN